ncbi:ROK family protein [Brevibacillus brevis]|uniref:ROK family protein n=1 Tax=Brevibacillus brevis TaxID=1393 RepID=UPI000D102335|nr:ROK family protein [Brevibacillus brevis]PSJ71325.1 glucokinase [Brevibacillus brevis]RED28935.1 glucokinase [Brevibacillus brevis]GEC90256.1 glucokinase [Brevibacillus brevis]VEF91470.1 Glucokinase [Brevibacillus brevis]
MAKEEYAIGLDLGGTKILAGLVDQDGRIIAQKQLPTYAEEGERAVIERVLSATHDVLSASGIHPEKVRGVGIASAGVINSDSGEVIFASNLGWRNVPIGLLIEQRFGLPVRLFNDANAAAIAEWLWGAGVGTRNMIYVTVSTGVGAGIVSDGRLISGRDGSAGEFGHISIDWNGPPCRCGNRGCLENYASGTAIESAASHKLVSTKEPVTDGILVQNGELTAKDICEAALAGDAFFAQIVKQAGFYLGIGAANLIYLFNPEVIVFGGGVMNASALLLPEIEKSMRDRCIPGLVQGVRVALSQIGAEAGVMGAAGGVFALNQPGEKPQNF